MDCQEAAGNNTGELRKGTLPLTKSMTIERRHCRWTASVGLCRLRALRQTAEHTRLPPEGSDFRGPAESRIPGAR